MFEYIKGLLVEADAQKAIIDVNGIGYKIFIPACIYPELLNKKDVLLYLSYVVKEDSHTLYGFLSKLQRNVFHLLTTISGIGPKTAISLLGHLNIENLHFAVTTGDVKSISRVPGIGRKTAERIILELKDKFKTLDTSLIDITANTKNSCALDAIAALMNLGYNSTQAGKAVKSVLESHTDQLELSSLITLALKNI
ncbi:MAG: Holliday junction DNA helicase [uncultured bacterium]|nr:MAG: Holliday junction DNA helicase [uncultured bacterium]